MKCLFKYIVIIVLLVESITAFTQDFKDIRIDRIASEVDKQERGLSQNSVQCIIQDNDGFMWFGTWDGLNRYDGYSFKIIRPDQYNTSTSLSSPTIRTMFIDTEGNLWVGTEVGLNKYSSRTKQFTQFKSNPKNINSLSNESINCITEDDKGNLWIGTNDGLNCMNKRTGNVKRFQLNPINANSLSNNAVKNIVYDKRGILFIATDKGLNEYNIKEDVFYHYYHDVSDKNSISSDYVNCVFIDNSKNIWVGTDKGLNLFDERHHKFRIFKNDLKNPNSLSNDDVRSIIRDKNGMYWIGTYGGGVNYMNSTDFKFNSIRNNPYDVNTISNDYINCVYEDRSGILWAGTSWKGVNRIDNKSNLFNHYFASESNESNTTINNNIVWAIVNDKEDNIWIGTNYGVNILNKKTDEFSYITHNERDKASLISNKVRAIQLDKLRKNIVWLGTDDDGLDKYDITTQKCKHFRYDPNSNSISSNKISSLFQDDRGEIWIGTQDGLSILNPETEKFAIYKHNDKDSYSISCNLIYPIYQDRKGVMWIGTYNGLNRYDKKLKRFYNYFSNPQKQFKLNSQKIFSVYQDKKGIYWVGTMGGGLNKLNPVTDEAKYYTENEGLPSNVVYCTIEDNKGNFWMSTNFGLSRFNPSDESFINFDVRDGIQSHEFNFPAFCKDNAGELYFGGMNGFNRFAPEKIKVNKNIPSLVITSFKVFNTEVPKSTNDGDTIYLNYDDNFFSFEFASLDYVNSSKNKYSYYLENYDKKWITAIQGRRFAEYTDVEPGEYIFRLKGSNNDGVWNTNGISIHIIIHPPWYKTILFKIAFLLFLIASIWLFIYFRVRNLRRKHKIEKEVLSIQKQLFELEQKSLRLQMNPHFIFNSLNSIQSFILENDIDKALFYLSKFSQLMRLILSNSQKSYVSVKDDLKALQYYIDIEKLRFDNKFDYEIIIDEEIDEDFFGIPPLVIQPYVENSIIHGLNNKKSKGFLTIELKMLEENILCIVQDNGIGREAADKIRENSGILHKSKGMNITKERLEILSNTKKYSVNIIDLKDEKGNPTGTRIEFMIAFIEL